MDAFIYVAHHFASYSKNIYSLWHVVWSLIIMKLTVGDCELDCGEFVSNNLEIVWQIICVDPYFSWSPVNCVWPGLSDIVTSE